MPDKPSSRILVVDDESDTTDLLSYQLESAGFEVRTLNQPLKVLGMVREFRPDLILLDIMMPELSGIQVCHMLKADQEIGGTPVIFLTAKGESEDRVKGLEIGADDYIGKPFNTKEMVLRVKAVLKRTREARSPAKRVIRIGKLLADKDLHQASVGDEIIVLTATEFKLLQLLMENCNRVQTREVLLSRVWNYESSTETRTVDTHIRRLREKLGEAATMIETVRGVGYRMVSGDEKVDV